VLVPEVDWNLCVACYPCSARKDCKTRAIVQIDPDEPVYIELERCSRCGNCVRACCCEAIRMVNL